MATLSLFADLSQLATIRDFVQETAQALGLPKRQIYDLQLAVDEACSNVIRHAYGKQGGPIQVTIEALDGSLRVTIRDWGKAFEPSAVPTPDVTAPLAERPLGGLGLYLMRQLMDKLEFSFHETDGNTLVMEKSVRGREA